MLNANASLSQIQAMIKTANPKELVELSDTINGLVAEIWTRVNVIKDHWNLSTKERARLMSIDCHRRIAIREEGYSKSND